MGTNSGAQTREREGQGGIEGTRQEWAARVELAACYRIVDLLGWSEQIFNHISLRVPGDKDHILINPFGLSYNEVTASNLVKIDLDGNIIGSSEWPVNLAGIVIHTAIHSARSDVACVLHIHTVAGSAVAGLSEGLDWNNFYSAMLYGHVAYHAFEGVTVEQDESMRLTRSLGSRNLMLLRNHGLLSCGTSVAQALNRMILLYRACEVQLATMSMGHELMPVSNAARERSTAAGAMLVAGGSVQTDPADLVFAALQRKIDTIDTSYKQ